MENLPMVEKTYRCNLCGETGKPERLLGILWSYNGFFQRSAIEAVDPKTSEHHLCSKCVYDLRAIFEDIKHHVPAMDWDNPV
jgi:hypothetical protein